METKEAIKSPSRIKNFDNVTYNIEMAGRPNADKTYNLYLRITQNRKHRKKKLFSIESKGDFNPKAKFGSWIRTENLEAKKLNGRLKKAIREAEDIEETIRKKGTTSSTSIMSKVKKTDSKDFLKYANEREQYFYNSGSYRNYKKYRNFINRLKEYVKADTLCFSEIDSEFILGFETSLKNKKNIRRPEYNLHPNSVARHLIIFRAILKHAEADKHLKPADNPFLSYKPKEIATRKEKLSMEEIHAIEGLKLAPNSTLWHCRNYFLFSFYCAGIRAGDLIILKWNNVTNDERLEYTTGKNSKILSIKLFEDAAKILKYYSNEGRKPNEYIFPLIDNNAPFAFANTAEERQSLPLDLKRKMYNAIDSKLAIINSNLKEIAKQAEINKPLSFHISRHSYANIARQKNENLYDIKNTLGHSSVQVTERYVSSFDNKSMDESMERTYK